MYSDGDFTEVYTSNEAYCFEISSLQEVCSVGRDFNELHSHRNAAG